MTVSPANPILVTASASSVRAKEKLGASVIDPAFTFGGVFGETITGTLAWKDSNVIPSEQLASAGGTGIYQAVAIFTPGAPFDVNYAATEVNIAVSVTVNKDELQTEYDDILNAGGGAGLPGIHEDNYLASDVAALRNAEAAASTVLSDPLATQTEVNAALANLQGALNTLLAKNDHPLTSSSHAAGLAAFGQDVLLEFKGDIRDVIGFALNGKDYPLTAGAASSYNISENGVVIGTITAGSAVVRLPAAFADRFTNGTHTVTVYFADPTTNVSVRQSGSGSISVNRTTGENGWHGGGAPIAPRTGDTTPLTMLFITAIVSLSALVLLRLLFPEALRARRGRKVS